MHINPDVDLSAYLRPGARCTVDIDFPAQEQTWSVFMLLSFRLDLAFAQ